MKLQYFLDVFRNFTGIRIVKISLPLQKIQHLFLILALKEKKNCPVGKMVFPAYWHCTTYLTDFMNRNVLHLKRSYKLEISSYSARFCQFHAKYIYAFQFMIYIVRKIIIIKKISRIYIFVLRSITHYDYYFALILKK